MIFLVVSQSHFCVATIVFYTCVWIPLLQLKKALSGILGMVSFIYQRPLMDITTSNTAAEPWLPVSRFVDLPGRGTCQRRSGQTMEESCSICLAEFEEQDVVSQLSKCGHVFHMNCIEKWLDCNQFTCPLCRSSFLDNVNANSHEKPLDEINPYIPSYLGFSWH
ncbi:RING-H2 finger protein ATL18 [Morus notabilis]|uniref:RING-H2 finger protein ATL18 n=1 Tax=Morus notabilis TaxID=981085 RepID=W9QLH5_9ROSA|nr:RING-H2 finger protein ATL18 [Morus notabilis]EXB40454.1 RING-H2 finger protein ATL18 [Morus notabilis]